MSYGPDPAEVVHGAAGYVDRILSGATPAALPVRAPTQFDRFVNLKAACGQGVEPSAALPAQADEVVE